MLTRIVIALSILLVILVASMAPKLVNGPAAPAVADQHTTQAAATMPDRVEVQQQIVQAVETTEARRAERPTSPVARRVIRQESPAASVTLIQRAARTLVGDGRHRPEPFPRAR